MLFCFHFVRTKLSLTRWSADWKSATVLYEQAGMCSVHFVQLSTYTSNGIVLIGKLLIFAAANAFSVAKDYEKAKEAFEKASKGQEMISSYPNFICLLHSIMYV